MNALRAYRLGIILSLLHYAPLPYRCFKNSRQAACHLAGYMKGFEYDVEQDHLPRFLQPRKESQCQASMTV